MPVSPALQLREQILVGLDPHLEAIGFRRRKRSFEWFRHPATGLTQGIHLNFGARNSRLDIIPTLQAGIDVVERELVAADLKVPSKNACTFSYQLHTLLDCEYVAFTDQGPEPMIHRLFADIQRHGLPRLARLTSLESVATLLLSADPKDWPVSWGSMRARVVPLVLALLGQTNEAQSRLARLREDLAGRDQLRPSMEHFAAWFTQRFGQAA